MLEIPDTKIHLIALHCCAGWEASDFLSQLLALLCMPLGRKARGQGQKWGAFGAAVSTLPIPLVFKCIWWHRPGQGHGYLAALVVDFCVSGAERRQELGSLGVTITWNITLLTSRKVEGILCSTQHWQFFCAIQQCIPLLQFLVRERTVSDNGH